MKSTKTSNRLGCILVALAITFSFMLPAPVVAAEVEKASVQSTVVDMEVATTVALLFVLDNLDITEWDMSTNIESIITLYNNDDEVNGYCINLNTGGNQSYVVVSANPYVSLIQEYSDTAAFPVSDEQDSASRAVADQRAYFYGPLSYSATKQIEAVDSLAEAAEVMDSIETLNDNLELVNTLRTTGLLPVKSVAFTVDPNSYQARSWNFISDPLTYLRGLYPYGTFVNTDYYNIGDSSIYSYVIDYDSYLNGCGVWGTAALLHYYLKNNYTFSTVLRGCKTVAENNGYATALSGGRWDYYIATGDLAIYVRECINYFYLGKFASSSLLTWSTGANEISNNRPILLNIGYSDQYEDHTVTAFAWTSFNVTTSSAFYNFFKVKDGYTSGSRYVNHNAITLSYITRVY